MSGGGEGGVGSGGVGMDAGMGWCVEERMGRGGEGELGGIDRLGRNPGCTATMAAWNPSGLNAMHAGFWRAPFDSLAFLSRATVFRSFVPLCWSGIVNHEENVM